MPSRRRIRPYRTPALILWAVAAVLIGGSIIQLFFGIPISEGIAPAGFSLGPILAIGAFVLFASQRPHPADPRDDMLPVRQMETFIHTPRD